MPRAPHGVPCAARSHAARLRSLHVARAGWDTLRARGGVGCTVACNVILRATRRAPQVRADAAGRVHLRTHLPAPARRLGCPTQCAAPWRERRGRHTCTRAVRRHAAPHATPHATRSRSHARACHARRRGKIGACLRGLSLGCLCAWQVVDGRVVGAHTGLAAYTIGQRARISGCTEPWCARARACARTKRARERACVRACVRMWECVCACGCVRAYACACVRARFRACERVCVRARAYGRVWGVRGFMAYA
jgi:hypothetical protein